MAPGNQFTPAIVNDGAGNLLAAWNDRRNDAGDMNWDIYIQKAAGDETDARIADLPPSAGGGRLLFPVGENPSSGASEIGFWLNGPQRIVLEVHDLAGGLVRRLVDQEELAAGDHRVSWDGRDAAGRAVRAGVYFVELRAPDRREHLRIVRLR